MTKAKKLVLEEYHKLPPKKKRRAKGMTQEQWDKITGGIKPPTKPLNILTNGIPK